MLQRRYCNQCDSTGIDGKGFCQVCKGQGYTEVLGTKKTPLDVKLLLHAVARNTTAEQFSRILDCYMDEPQ